MPIFAYGIKNIYLEMFSRFICFCSGYEKGKNIPTNMRNFPLRIETVLAFCELPNLMHVFLE